MACPHLGETPRKTKENQNTFFTKKKNFSFFLGGHLPKMWGDPNKIQLKIATKIKLLKKNTLANKQENH